MGTCTSLSLARIFTSVQLGYSFTFVSTVLLPPEVTDRIIDFPHDNCEALYALMLLGLSRKGPFKSYAASILDLVSNPHF
jgi:hypothetical protein